MTSPGPAEVLIRVTDGGVVPEPTATGVSRVIKFHDPGLVVMFGFPDVFAD